MNKELNFDLKQLRSFLEVIERKSFTKASRNLRVGQATVSTHIQSLEDAFGVRLFKRTSKDFTVTREGEIFRKFCDKIFKDLEDLQKMYSSHMAWGIVPVACSTIPSGYILPRAISRIHNKMPEMQFRLEVSDSREAVEMIKEGTAEIGVVGKMLKHPLLKYEKIFSDEIVLISPAKKYPDVIDISEIKSFTLVTREKGSGTRDSYERELISKGVSPTDLKVVLECSTSDGVREAVSAGLGAAFISRLAVSDEISGLKNIKIIKIRGVSISRDFFLVYAKNRVISDAVKVLIRELKGLDMP